MAAQGRPQARVRASAGSHPRCSARSCNKHRLQPAWGCGLPCTAGSRGAELSRGGVTHLTSKARRPRPHCPQRIFL